MIGPLSGSLAGPLGVARRAAAAGPLAAPSDLAVAATGSTYADLTWSAATGGDTSGDGYSYQARYSAASGGPWTDSGAPTSATSARVTGLDSGATYYFTVVVTDDAASTDTSNEASGATAETAISALGASVALFFDEGSGDFLDESGNSRDASSANIARVAEGVTFDGASYFDLPSLPYRTLLTVQSIPLAARGFFFRTNLGGTQIAVNYNSENGVLANVSDVRDGCRIVESSNNGSALALKDGWKASACFLDFAGSNILRYGAINTTPGSYLTSGTLAAVVAFESVLTEAELEAAHNAIVSRLAGRSAAIDAAIGPVELPTLVTASMASPASFLEGLIPSPYSGTLDGDGRDTGDFNVHPSVLDMEVELGAGQAWNGYRYWMAYTPYPDQLTSAENPCIVASSDGETWVTPAGVTNPIVAAPATGYNSDVALAMDPDGSTMHLLWRDYHQANDLVTHKHLSSTDGFATLSAADDLFSHDTALGNNELSASLFHEGGRWKIYTVLRRYSTTGDAYNTFRLREGATIAAAGAATPTDCEAPPYYEGSLRGPWHAEVRPDARVGGYAALVGNSSTGSAAGTHHGYALTSTDGVTWYVSRTPLLLASGAANLGDWDSGQIYRLSFAATAAGWDVWYSARGTVAGDDDYGADSEFRIGRSSVTL